MKKKNFTIIEVMIAIGIITVLLGIIIVGYQRAPALGRDSKRVSDLGIIAEVLERYYKDHYPPIDPNNNLLVAKSTEQSWTNLQNEINNENIQIALPLDPSNDENYYYTYCIDNESNPQKYILMAKLETKSQVLKESYKGELGDCNCALVEGQDPPYPYCIRNP